MATGINALFSQHERALQVQGKRLELIASNLANADTPGFKARDIDFRQVLSNASSGDVSLKATSSGHISLGALRASEQYRVPLQPSLDGNTVDSNTEKTMISEASIRYESTLEFLSRKISGLRAAFNDQ